MRPQATVSRVATAIRTAARKFRAILSNIRAWLSDSRYSLPPLLIIVGTVLCRVQHESWQRNSHRVIRRRDLGSDLPPPHQITAAHAGPDCDTKRPGRRDWYASCPAVAGGASG